MGLLSKLIRFLGRIQMPFGKFSVVLVLLLLPLLHAKAAEPTTQPAGAVSGKVTSPGEVPLSEMVVYLEAPDAKREFVVQKNSVKVSQKGAKFSPAVVIVCVGQTVDFLNDED